LGGGASETGFRKTGLRLWMQEKEGKEEKKREKWGSSLRSAGEKGDLEGIPLEGVLRGRQGLSRRGKEFGKRESAALGPSDFDGL